MELKDRMIYSAEQMQRALDSAMDQMKVFRYDGQYRTLLGERFIEKLARWERDIGSCSKALFTLVVAGDFKRGKSTFINALLGEEVVTTDVTTETVTLNTLRYGQHENAAVISENSRMRLSDRELKREELEKIMAASKEPIKRLELTRPCEFLKDITIVDTPGLGDAMKDFSGMVEDALLHADAVVYLYSVEYPLSQTEQLFLKAAVLPQLYTTLFLAGNYADVLGNETNFERMKQMLEGRVHGLLPDTDIYMVSALDELCRQLEYERPCDALIPVLEKQFDGLREEIRTLIANKKDTVIRDRICRLVEAMTADLAMELDALEAGLSMSDADAAEAIERLRSQRQTEEERHEQLTAEIKKNIESMRLEAVTWMREFLRRMEGEVKNLSGESTDELLKYYSFYCVDLLQEALNTCVDTHRERLYDRLEEISRELAGKLVSAFGDGKKYNFRMSLDNKIWTKGDTASLAISMASSFGLFGNIANVASLIADGVSGMMRQKEKEARTDEIVAQIAGKLTGLELSVEQTVSDMYRMLSENAEKMIADFYADELADAERLLEQTIDVSNRNKEEKDKIRAAVAQARRVLQDAQKELA